MKKVTVYTTPTCTWSNTLKTYLKNNSIPFTDVDVTRDYQAAGEFFLKSGLRGVPQTDVDGELVIGYNEQRLKELLEIK